jgi:hypothetical protein
MLDAAERGGQEHFVIVFHSFSAIKPRDVTYSMMRPNRIVIRRLETMFRYLAEHSTRFRVHSMGEFAQRADDLAAVTAPPVITDLPVMTSFMRKAVQLINNVYWV